MRTHHDFKIVSKYKPSGDQPKAIEQLVEGIKAGDDTQTLLGYFKWKPERAFTFQNQ